MLVRCRPLQVRYRNPRCIGKQPHLPLHLRLSRRQELPTPLPRLSQGTLCTPLLWVAHPGIVVVLPVKENPTVFHHSVVLDLASVPRADTHTLNLSLFIL